MLDLQTGTTSEADKKLNEQTAKIIEKSDNYESRPNHQKIGG